MEQNMDMKTGQQRRKFLAGFLASVAGIAVWLLAPKRARAAGKKLAAAATGPTDSEKTRRRALLKPHYNAENDHDIDGIMATFAPGCEMLYNRTPFTDPQSIRDAHGLIGFSGTDGAFKDIQNYIDTEHFTEDEIIIEGRMSGKHVGEFFGIEATGRNVELPFVAFYHFDKTDKLISERIVMNLGVLVASG